MPGIFNFVVEIGKTYDHNAVLNMIQRKEELASWVANAKRDAVEQLDVFGEAWNRDI